MNLLRLIILYLILSTQLQADTIYNLIKIPNLEIYETDTSNKLRYLYAKQPFTIGIDNNINCYNSEKKDLDQKYNIIERNLNKYDQEFLKKINLKYIVLCQKLSISGILTAGIPDHKMKTLIIDIKFNSKHFERVIHHEVFHIINDGFKEYFNEKKWSKLNDEDFKYTACSTCSDKTGLFVYKEFNGFFTEYSKTTASEDMAEVYSHMVSHKDIVEFKTNKDPILKKKVEFIKKNILKIDKDFEF